MKKLFSLVLMSLIALFAMSFDIEREVQELTPIDVGITQGDSICDIASPMQVCGVDNPIIERCGCLTLFSTAKYKLVKEGLKGYSFKISGTEVRHFASVDFNNNLACNYKGIVEVRIRGHDYSTKA